MSTTQTLNDVFLDNMRQLWRHDAKLPPPNDTPAGQAPPGMEDCGCGKGAQAGC